jgi:polysaccharide export outer membrane protein
MSPALKFRILLFALLTSVSYFTFAAQVPTPQDTSSKSFSETAPNELVISGGDLLHLSVMGATEFDHDLRVSDSGQITLPMAGDLKIAGLNVENAQRLVAKKLRDANVFVDPQVMLFVKEYAVHGISVLGEVQKPGVYPLLGSHTLYDAISMAGGTTAKAGRVVTISHRTSPEKTVTVSMNNGPSGDTSGNVPISPGDTIVVSKAGMVYVVGEVRQPTGIVLDNPDLSVLQAISIAQGTGPNAALNDAKILRKSPKGVEQIPVRLKEILAAKSSDVTLKPEDVLFVPTSATKSAARRSMEAILQAATGVVIYRR